MKNNELAWALKWKGDKGNPGKDKLGITDKVEGFANIITSQNGNEVYGVTAPFGVGKTFFCECLNDWLKENDITSIFYNVWEVDFYEEPLEPLIYEVLEKLKLSKKKQAKSVMNKATSAFKGVISSIKAEGKVDVPGVCDVNITIDGEKAVKAYDVSEEKNKKEEDAFLKSYSSYKSNVNKFRDALESLFSNNGGKPTVVIIDELDRCRPDYAVKLLETIKHFFGIEGLVFVIAFDEDQLSDSVKKLYGTRNFRGYIDKFLDYSFSIPEPKYEDFYDVMVFKYNKNKLLFKNGITLIGGIFDVYGERVDNDRSYLDREKSIKQLFCNLANNFKFSLREFEQVFKKLVLSIKKLNEDKIIYLELLIFLICIKKASPDMFYSLKNRSSILRGLEKMILDQMIADFGKKHEDLWKSFKDKYYYIIKGASGKGEGALLELFFNISYYVPDARDSNYRSYLIMDRINFNKNTLKKYFSVSEFVDGFSSYD